MSASRARSDGGALGPELAAALRDYHDALARQESAETALETARRQTSESRARLRALTTGARVTGTRVLVPVDSAPEESVDPARVGDLARPPHTGPDDTA